jgi:cell division topological specificity factor
MFKFFRQRHSAPVARDRLKVLLAHERVALGKPDLINLLRQEILAVIEKHVSVDPEKVRIKAEREANVSTLSIDIEIPLEKPAAAAA